MSRPTSVLAVLAAATLLGCQAGSDATGPGLARSAHRERVLVVGLDGFTWDLARPWLAQGLLPNLGKMVAGGASASLRTVLPPASPPAWTSAITGVNPGKHGVFGFVRPMRLSLTPEFVSSDDRRCVPIWTLLSRAGRKVGVVNVPATSPPDPVNGFMVGGFPHGEGVPVGYPVDVLAEFPDYQLDAFAVIPELGGEDAWLSNLYAVEKARLRFSLAKVREPDWDLFFVVFTGPDRISHHFWKFTDPEHPDYDPELGRRYGGAIRDFYVAMDGALGALQDAAGPGVTTIVLSDHGFGPARRGIAGEKLMAALNPGLAASAQPEVYLHGFFTSEIRIAVRGREPFGSVEPGKPYEHRRNEARKALLALRNPADGLPLVSEVHRREDIYHGPAVGDAPDLVYRERDDYIVLPLPGSPGLVGRLPPEAFSGFHRLDGVLVLSGPGINDGTDLGTVSILDVAPTVLHLLGQPVPTYMDGRVLGEALSRSLGRAVARVELAPELYLEARSGVAAPPEGVEEQLRALGYLR